MIHHADDWLTVYGGDARDVLPTLPAASVHCVVTSPPYWGLRDYGSDGQLGLEATPEEYVANLVAVFREVRRVLRDDGTVWLNLGSSYASGGSGSSRSPQPASAPAYGSDGTAPSGSPDLGSAYSGLCDGCLGDYLTHLRRSPGTDQPFVPDGQPRPSSDRGTGRQGSGQASPDASPLDAPASTSLQSWRQQRGPCSRCDSRASSLSGAPTSADDAQGFSRNSWLNYTRSLKPKDLVPIPWMVAMALQQDGWYLRRDVIWAKPNPMPESVTDRPTSSHEYLFLLAKRSTYYFDQEAVREVQVKPAGSMNVPHFSYHPGNADPKGGGVRGKGGLEGRIETGNRNLRSVWTIATRPYPGAHFAVFPPELPERCIKAGTSETVCSGCGSPWMDSPPKLRSECDHGFAPVPATVLDPFAGSGTVGMVANRLSRRAILIDLNPAYLEQQMARNAQVPVGL